MRDPFVIAVLNAHGWTKRELSAAYPVLPHALKCGIEIYDAALAIVLAEERRIEAENARLEQDRTPVGVPHRMGPPPRRGSRHKR